MTSIVSVILPCYNGARWIREAIESVLAQTYKDFELIIVDDGSTDSSGKIVSLYSNDARVCYIYQKNRGFSAAINKGIRESSGDFVGFIGQDDLWMPKKLKEQVNYLRKHQNVDLVHSNYYIIDLEGKIVKKRNTKMQEPPSTGENVKELFLGNFIAFETVLVRKKSLEEVGVFDERMIAFSDHDMWLRIAGSSNIGYIDLPLVKKRHHEAQLSRVREEAGIKDELLITKKAIDRYPFLRKYERKKLTDLYYAWGVALLVRENRKQAKQKFLKSIKYQPWKLKATAAYVAPALYEFIWERYREVLDQLLPF